MITRNGDEVIALRAGYVVVDLARAEPIDDGDVDVDLAQADSTAAGAVRSWVAGPPAPDRMGRVRSRLLSPSWPLAHRLTNSFGTTDLIDARQGPTP